MTDFGDMMSAGAGEALAMLGTAITTGSGMSLVSKTCIVSNVDVQRIARESGFMPNYSTVAELTRAAATLLGLYPLETTGARTRCVVGGRNYQRVDVEDDPTDPMVRLRLEIYRA